MADAASYGEKVAKANMLLMLEQRSDEQRNEIRDEILLQPCRLRDRGNRGDPGQERAGGSYGDLPCEERMTHV